LRGAIEALVTDGDELRIDKLPGFESELSLSAVIGSEDEGVARVGESSFRCVLTRAGWERVVALLGPFAEPLESNSFQYLTEAGEIEWIVSTSGPW
jgi:hypothetical protein